MSTYTVEWEETTRFRVFIEAPGVEEATEVFWWYDADGRLHDVAHDIDSGAPQELSVVRDRENRTPHFTMKQYLEAQ